MISNIMNMSHNGWHHKKQRGGKLGARRLVHSHDYAVLGEKPAACMPNFHGSIQNLRAIAPKFPKP